jgi:hypothetical protein
MSLGTVHVQELPEPVPKSRLEEQDALLRGELTSNWTNCG